MLNLKKAMAKAYKQGESPAKLPKPWGVVYDSPNPDGSRKACGNCMMYITEKGGLCAIHGPDVRMTPDRICGYYVYGKPMEKMMPMPGMKPVDPKFSGMNRAPGGVSCDVCIYYVKKDEEKGLCRAVQGEDGGFAEVQAMGACSRYSPNPKETSWSEKIIGDKPE